MTAPQTESRIASAEDLAAFNQSFGKASSSEVIAVVARAFPGRIAVVSSFGTQSAVLLDLVARVDRTLPIIFLDTGWIFPETLAYRDALIDRLGLTNVSSVTPDMDELETEDPDGRLWATDGGRCCYLRKVAPLARALEGLDAWITGRKRFQTDSRAALPLFEIAEQRLKINPLAGWSKYDLDTYFGSRNLPRHPLEAEGFASIGCMPCTARTLEGEDDHSGRWQESDKTECGIHLPVPSIAAE